MRGRSSRAAMEVEKVKEEPQLSGAYIRSLVKQLTSSKTPKKDTITSTTTTTTTKGSIPPNLTKFGHDDEGEGPQPPPQHHKKQVRRRLHTTRPYQERLLNMAEARKEIVTALKFHRAAMKQANTDQNYHQPPPQPQHQPPPPPATTQLPKSRRNQRIYPSTNSNLPTFCCPDSQNSFLPNYSWPNYSSHPYQGIENLNYLTLPNQTLGLNLNIHDFNNLDANLYHNDNNDNNSNNITNHEEDPVAILPQGTPPPADGLHQAMDDEEMAEIRSIGEQHEMEWNDTVNLVTSAWWFKFLKSSNNAISAEIDGDHGYKEYGNNPFDQVLLEFPAWLNPNDYFNVEHCLDDSYNLQDPALPCMDIGEIEGMVGEWLA